MIESVVAQWRVSFIFTQAAGLFSLQKPAAACAGASGVSSNLKHTTLALHSLSALPGVDFENF